MKTLYDKEVVEDCIKRIESLQANSPAIWGKMNVAQMLEHCSIGMETLRNQRVIKRVFAGYLFGKMMKASFYNDKPYKKNLPTAKELTMSHPVDFERAKNTLIEHLRSIQSAGPENCTKHPHAFFGYLTAEQWGTGMYKHLDHHLQQFGA